MRGAYFTLRPVFHKTSLYQFDYEITLESVHGINQY